MRAIGIIVFCFIIGAVVLRLIVNHWYAPYRRRHRMEDLEAETKRLDELLRSRQTGSK